MHDIHKTNFCSCSEKDIVCYSIYVPSNGIVGPVDQVNFISLQMY